MAGVAVEVLETAAAARIGVLASRLVSVLACHGLGMLMIVVPDMRLRGGRHLMLGIRIDSGKGPLHGQQQYDEDGEKRAHSFILSLDRSNYSGR